MNIEAKLTKRESEIAELIAWGLCKKEVASQLSISVRTVENHTRNIYEKTGCVKVNELSAWWFCTRFNISIQLSPRIRKASATALLSIFLCGSVLNISEFVRELRTRNNGIICNVTRRRGRECEDINVMNLQFA